VLLAILLQIHSSETYNQTAPTAQSTNREQADIQACKQQLRRILDAVREYQKQYNKLPNWFFDLHPKFIADPKTFFCPVVQRLGDLRSWRNGVRGDVFWDPFLATSYTYEFSAKELPLAPGVETTWQEYKKRQMTLVGDRVPVARCFAHDPERVLNLSIGGRFYTSGRHWEDEFTNIVSHEEMAEQSVFRDLLTGFLKRPRSFPLRSAAASARLLDLTESYNLGLNETVKFKSIGGEDLASLPQGAVNIDGLNILFDIRGRVQLKGKRLRMPFPPRVDGIKVNQQCRRVHFLCGTVYGAATGTEIGRFEVHYANGQSNRIQIIYGKHVQDWWFDPREPQTGDPRMVWQEVNPASQAQDRSIRLYSLEWENPLKNVEIATFDFVSAVTDSAPFLIAITLE